MLSRRRRSLFLTKVAQNRFKLRQDDVKNASLQGQDTDQDVQLVADPVAELAEHLHLSKEQVVVLTKFCYGQIDAPRRWWLTLQHDWTQQGWRSCTLKPCMMTLHWGSRLVGILSYHVDDLMLAGDESDPLFFECTGNDQRSV